MIILLLVLIYLGLKVHATVPNLFRLAWELNPDLLCSFGLTRQCPTACATVSTPKFYSSIVLYLQEKYETSTEGSYIPHTQFQLLYIILTNVHILFRLSQFLPCVAFCFRILSLIPCDIQSSCRLGPVLTRTVFQIFLVFDNVGSFEEY